MRKRLFLMLLSLAAGLVPVGVPREVSAQGAGGGAFQFAATGTLPDYPTYGEIKQASMSGTITGNGQVSGLSGTTAYTANFTLKAAPFTNQPIRYQVNGLPYCLAASQAHGDLAHPYYGNVTVDSYATAGHVAGQVYVSPDTVMGGVTRTIVTFEFTYQRVGAGAVIVVDEGRATIFWQNVNGTSGSFVAPFTGAGPAVVQYTDAAAANQACVLGPQAHNVGFAVTGNIEAAGA